MSNSVGTVNTSQEDEGSNRDEKIAVFIGILIFVLASPLTALTGVITWLLFSYAKIRRSVLSLAFIPFAVAGVFFWKTFLDSFYKAWTVTVPHIFSQEISPVLGILTMLGQQAPIAVPIGLLLGIAYSSYRWWTRPRWQEFNFKRAPWEISRAKKVIRQIENDENTPLDGVTLGVDKVGNRVVQTQAEAGANTLVIGGSGSGKTTTLMARIRDSIKHGEGLCFIDLKGGDDVPQAVAMYAERYGRKFQHWTIQDITKDYTGPATRGNSYYDPLAQGDHTRRADMILELREWDAGSDYFRKLSQSYLQLLFTVLINNPRSDISTLEYAVELMNPKYLQKQAIPLAGNPIFSSVVTSIDNLNDEKISNAVRENLATNRSVLEIFLQSTAGPWLTLDNKNDNNISLLDAAYNGDVVVFSLDSSAYPQLSGSLANLIIQDLKTASSELRKHPAEQPFQVVVDEFSAIGSDNIIGLINKSRDARMPTTLATQTLADLIVANPAVKDQIMGIVGSFIIHRANIATDAEVYAGLTGMTTRTKFRQTVEHQQGKFGGIGSGLGAGGGSVEQVEEYRVMPTEIQDLSIGQMIYISTSKHRLEKVQCIPEKEALAFAPHQQIHKAIDAGALHEISHNPLSLDIPSASTSSGSSIESSLPSGKLDLVKEPIEETDSSAPVSHTPTDYNLLKSFFNNPDALPAPPERPAAAIETPAPVLPASKPAFLDKPVIVKPTPPQESAPVVARPTLPGRPASPFKPKVVPPKAPANLSQKPVPKIPTFTSLDRNAEEASEQKTRSKDEFEF